MNQKSADFESKFEKQMEHNRKVDGQIADLGGKIDFLVKTYMEKGKIFF